MKSRLSRVRDLARNCRLCPRNCEVDRLSGELGICQIGYGPMISSANLHFGEEPPISGFRGSGTIFLTGCNLQCKFCQNFPISQYNHGNSLDLETFAHKCLLLQKQGAHNINFVTPTHQAVSIFEGLILAYERGLNIPLVYNSGGYESLEMIKLWDGIIDVYMPDSKYSSDESAKKVSNAPEYVEHNRAALKEMQRQVGVLQLDDDDIAVQGLLIRHLVLPHDLSGTGEVLRFIAQEISKETYLSLMSQYFPAYRASTYAQLKDRITVSDYRKACRLLKKYGLDNGWTQPYQG